MTRAPAFALARLLPAAVSAAFIAGYVFAAAQRLNYGYELEWMEGAMVDAVRRVLAGQPLYADASLEYVPFIYPPLFFHVSAALAWPLGAGFLPLRLVSLVSSLGCIALCYAFVRREGGDRASALTAAGLFGATYALSGTWFDLGRVDSLFLLLLLASLYGLRFARTPLGQAGAGVVLAAAFFTKQVALSMAAPAVLYMLVRDRRLGASYAASALITSAAWFGVVELATAGRYRHYAFQVPGRHSIAWAQWSRMWLEDLWQPLPISCALAALAVFAGLRSRSAAGPRANGFHACMALGVLAGCWLSRMHVGGFRNVVMPAYAVLAILAGLGLAALRARPARAGASGRLLELAAGVALLLQFWWLRYDPRAAVPSTDDHRAAAQLNARIAALPGRVLIPFHGGLAARAGKPPHGHQMAFNDLYRGGYQQWKRADDELERAIAQQAFGAIVLDEPGWKRGLVEQHYELTGRLLPAAVELRALAGMQTAPRLLYLPRRAPP